MKLLLRRRHGTEVDSSPAGMPEDIESELAPGSLADEYALTIHFCLTQQGVDHGQVHISVRSIGTTVSGLEVYAGFIKVVRWSPTVRALLVQMPWVERRIEKRLRHDGLLQYSQFGGLWFRAPGLLAGDPPRP
jgi:hypothetical protein